jgi:hypothetical protein
MAAHLQPKQPQGRDHESMDTSFRTKQTKDIQRLVCICDFKTVPKKKTIFKNTVKLQFGI